MIATQRNQNWQSREAALQIEFFFFLQQAKVNGHDKWQAILPLGPGHILGQWCDGPLIHLRADFINILCPWKSIARRYRWCRLIHTHQPPIRPQLAYGLHHLTLSQSYRKLLPLKREIQSANRSNVFFLSPKKNKQSKKCHMMLSRIDNKDQSDTQYKAHRINTT